MAGGWVPGRRYEERVIVNGREGGVSSDVTTGCQGEASISPLSEVGPGRQGAERAVSEGAQ